jgi:hypothetical protein
MTRTAHINLVGRKPAGGRRPLRLSAQGRHVEELLGGFDHWVREGHPVEGDRSDAPARRVDHPLVG